MAKDGEAEFAEGRREHLILHPIPDLLKKPFGLSYMRKEEAFSLLALSLLSLEGNGDKIELPLS